MSAAILGAAAASRSPSGERGLKCLLGHLIDNGNISRSPSGERGLKWLGGVSNTILNRSLPIRGAWIEIP